MFKRLIRPTLTLPDTAEGRLCFRLLSFFLNREQYELKWQFAEGTGRRVYIVERRRKKGEKGHGR